LGNIRYYHLWTPKNIVSGKKYPVLIAQELNTWFPYFEIATDCGYYVAVVDRPFSHTWNGAQQKTWTEDVQSLCASIANKPEINTNKVYFFAYSAETYYLSDLLNRNSQLWKGAVLFSPVSLPDATGLNGKKILLIDGKDDEVAVSRLSEYQNHATALGTSPTIYILANAGHIPQSGASERSRARQFANFLSANR
jgi:predicted esterase